MSSEDPERLLSEALRAQAIRTPGTPAPTADKSPVVYGLLSGTDLNVPQAAPEETHRLVEAPKQVSAWLVLALALFLGLAAGAVVGLLTLV